MASPSSRWMTSPGSWPSATSPSASSPPPAAVAQEVAELLVTAGVTSVLNFAPTVIAVPAGVSLRKVDLSIELQILSFYQQRRDESAEGGSRSGAFGLRRGSALVTAVGGAVTYPVSLTLAGRRVLVVGGGRVATRRVGDLLEGEPGRGRRHRPCRPRSRPGPATAG